MTPSGPMAVSSQREGFHVRSSSDYLDPVSKIYDVFSNRDFPSTSRSTDFFK